MLFYRRFVCLFSRNPLLAKTATRGQELVYFVWAIASQVRTFERDLCVCTSIYAAEFVACRGTQCGVLTRFGVAWTVSSAWISRQDANYALQKMCQDESSSEVQSRR